MPRQVLYVDDAGAATAWLSQRGFAVGSQIGDAAIVADLPRPEYRDFDPLDIPGVRPEPPPALGPDLLAAIRRVDPATVEEPTRPVRAAAENRPTLLGYRNPALLEGPGGGLEPFDLQADTPFDELVDVCGFGPSNTTTLEGPVVVKLFWIAGVEEAVSKEDLGLVTDQLVKACEWIACRSDRTLRWIYEPLETLHVEPQAQDPADHDPYERLERPWMDPALRQLGLAPEPMSIRTISTRLRESRSAERSAVGFITRFPKYNWAYADRDRFVLDPRGNSPIHGKHLYQAIRHELLHLFGASDEYDCTPRAACLPNDNCGIPAATALRCCMHRLNRDALCTFTRREIGWPG